MAAAEELRAVFTAEDRTSSVLRAIGAQLRGLSGSSGIGRLTQAGGHLLGTVTGLARGIATMGLSIAGLGGAASAAGLTALAVGAASTGAELKALADASGVPIGRLEVLADMARRANVSQEDLGSGLGGLNERMRAAARGGNSELRQVMSRLRISLRDSSGQVRNAADVLPQLADAFQRVRDPALRAEAANAIFGEAGARLLPILTGGAEGLREGQRQFDRYGVSVAENAETLAAAKKQFDDLRSTMLGFAASISTAIGTELAPILGPIASDMAKWVQENRAWIATGIAQHVREGAEAVRGFFADRGPIERLRDFWEGAKSVVASLGGLRTIMLGFAALVAAPFVAGILSVVSNVALLAGGIARLGLALMTTPVGWFIGIVAGLGYAAYKIWENWEPIVAWFSGIWTRLREVWGPQVALLREMVTGLGGFLGGLIATSWSNSPLARFFEGLRSSLDAIMPLARGVAKWVRQIFGEAAGKEPEASSNPAMNAPAQAERTRRFGARANRFDDDGNRIEWNGGRLPASPAAPLARPVLPPSPIAAPSSGGRGERGSIEATVRFENAPPGTRVEATSSGVVDRPRTDVGINLRGSR